MNEWNHSSEQFNSSLNFLPRWRTGVGNDCASCSESYDTIYLRASVFLGGTNILSDHCLEMQKRTRFWKSWFLQLCFLHIFWKNGSRKGIRGSHRPWLGRQMKAEERSICLWLLESLGLPGTGLMSYSRINPVLLGSSWVRCQFPNMTEHVAEGTLDRLQCTIWTPCAMQILLWDLVTRWADSLTPLYSQGTFYTPSFSCVLVWFVLFRWSCNEPAFPSVLDRPFSKI